MFYLFHVITFCILLIKFRDSLDKHHKNSSLTQQKHTGYNLINHNKYLKNHTILVTTQRN